MAFETKELEGALFPNENRTSENSPHFTGEERVEGKLWRLAAWKNTSKQGEPYLKLKIEVPREGKFKPANEKPAEKDPWI